MSRNDEISHLVCVTLIRVAKLPYPAIKGEACALLHNVSCFVSGSVKCWSISERDGATGRVGLGPHRSRSFTCSTSDMGLHGRDIVSAERILYSLEVRKSATGAADSLGSGKLDITDISSGLAVGFHLDRA